MELIYYADSKRLPLEDIRELNDVIFDGWDDGDMPFNDTDNPLEGLRVISEEEFLQSELEF